MNAMARHGAMPILCNLSDLAEGRPRGFAPDPAKPKSKIILVRLGDRVVAWHDACPHYGGTPMAWKSDAYLSGDGMYMACHSHNALFEIDTGICIAGPCLGQSLTPATVAILDDGSITAPE